MRVRSRPASGSRCPGRLNRLSHIDRATGEGDLIHVIDHHSRVAYAEARDDETKDTATAVLRNAVAWSAVGGVNVYGVLGDNGGC